MSGADWFVAVTLADRFVAVTLADWFIPAVKLLVPAVSFNIEGVCALVGEIKEMEMLKKIIFKIMNRYTLIRFQKYY
jgi:hypothetical protein